MGVSSHIDKLWSLPEEHRTFVAEQGLESMCPESHSNISSSLFLRKNTYKLAMQKTFLYLPLFLIYPHPAILASSLSSPSYSAAGRSSFFWDVSSGWNSSPDPFKTLSHFLLFEACPENLFTSKWLLWKMFWSSALKKLNRKNVMSRWTCKLWSWIGVLKLPKFSMSLNTNLSSLEFNQVKEQTAKRLDLAWEEGPTHPKAGKTIFFARIEAWRSRSMKTQCFRMAASFFLSKQKCSLVLTLSQ